MPGSCVAGAGAAEVFCSWPSCIEVLGGTLSHVSPARVRSRYIPSSGAAAAWCAYQVSHSKGRQ